jgi:hypothetical protein
MKLSVNVVAKPGWILERCARELVERIPGAVYNATGYPPQRPSDETITYFLPAKDVRHMPGVTGIKVGLFTHGDDRTAAYYDQLDACVAMNRHVFEHLRELRAQNARLIRPGTEPPRRPIRFGVCGRVYGKGRKGADLVRAAVGAGFSFRACSERNSRERRPPCRITHPIERRSEFYEEIDYLVVTSTEEGGPMPVIEAIAHGVPVIAPDVGWCWEFPVIRYERGSWESLRRVLKALTRPPTWEAWAEGHRLLFESLLGRAT